jgi:hypothetical protein|tara:strand:- start:526 stop:855 length:330 start_codon:yes stop_codon:yes gene_type:complete
MKVITLLSIFVVFYLINGIIACSSKENFEDSPENAATQVTQSAERGLASLLRAMGNSGATQGSASEEDDQDKKDGAEIIRLSAADEAFDDDDDTSVDKDGDLFAVEDVD